MKKIRNTSDCRWSFHSFTVSYFAITMQIKRIRSSGISLRLYIYFISLLCSISRLFSIFSNSSSDYLIRFLLFVSLLIRRGNVQWYIHSIVTYLFFFFYECCFFIFYASWLVISCIVLCMSTMPMLISCWVIHLFPAFFSFLRFLLLWNIHLRSCFPKHNTHKIFKSSQKGNIKLYDKRGKNINLN